jgi:hypothetical protein
MRDVLSANRHRLDAAHRMLRHAGPLGRARLCSFIASVGWVATGQTPRVEIAREAVELWRGLDDERRLHHALMLLAVQSACAGRHEDAEAALREARAIESPAWPMPARAAITEGWVALWGGDLQRCMASMSRAEALCRRAGDRRLAAQARVELAGAALRAGKLDEALEHSRAAVQAWRGFDQPISLGDALLTLCEASLAANDMAGARAAAEEALPLLELGGIPEHVNETFALLAASTGHCETAAVLLGHADAWRAANQSPRDPALQRVVARAAADIDDAIGAAESTRLRAAGADLSDAQVASLARSVLTAPARSACCDDSLEPD